MPVALGCDYDLFISYARQDDFAEPGQEGWVSQFLGRLEPVLRQRLGGAGKSLKIFFDRESVGANYQLPELLTTVKRSALFIAFGSPCYVASDWANQELLAFAAYRTDLSRIFVVESLPMNSGESYPLVLSNHARMQFWKASRYRHTPMTMSPSTDSEDFLPLVHSLAVDIRDKLMVMRVLPIAHSDTPVGAGQPEDARSERSQGVQRFLVTKSSVATSDRSGRAAKTAFLAQGTDDVEEEVEQLRNYLSQFDAEVTVVPSSGYPQAGEEFRAAVQADIAKAGLFVQLLGRRAGRKPPDLPEGYTLFQTAAARAAHLPILQWRHPEIDTATVTDAAYREILTAENVVASGLEAFKRQILDLVRTPEAKPRITKSSTVFINADDKDMTIAKEVERECLASALTTILPMAGPSSEANRRDLAETLTECDVLVFIYGDTTQDWIRAQLRFFSKVKSKREAEPKLLAICSGPPAKPEIGMSFPNARIVNCPEGWNLDPIRKLIQEVGQ